MIVTMSFDNMNIKIGNNNLIASFLSPYTCRLQLALEHLRTQTESVANHVLLY